MRVIALTLRPPGHPRRMLDPKFGHQFSRSKSRPQKTRFEDFPKEDFLLIGVDFQDPRPGETFSNSYLDLMGDLLSGAY